MAKKKKESLIIKKNKKNMEYKESTHKKKPMNVKWVLMFFVYIFAVIGIVASVVGVWAYNNYSEYQEAFEQGNPEPFVQLIKPSSAESELAIRGIVAYGGFFVENQEEIAKIPTQLTRFATKIEAAKNDTEVMNLLAEFQTEMSTIGAGTCIFPGFATGIDDAKVKQIVFALGNLLDGPVQSPKEVKQLAKAINAYPDLFNMQFLLKLAKQTCDQNTGTGNEQ